MALSQSPDLRVVACQQLMEDIHGSCWRDPFPGMNATFNKDSRIVRFKRNLDTFDFTSLICLAAYYSLHYIGILLCQVI